MDTDRAIWEVTSFSVNIAQTIRTPEAIRLPSIQAALTCYRDDCI
jgi:hypothetical protein